MCGRYFLLSPAGCLRKLFRLADVPHLRPRANIAPGSTIPAVRNEEGQGLSFFAPQWGLVPGWAKDGEMALRLKNARCESAAEKPAFREAWERRRCLIPADGFLEWSEGRGPKQPYGVRHRAGDLLVFAGLWERWYDPAETAPRALESCTILTTAARGALRTVHHRMPVMLQPHDFDGWLDSATSGAHLMQLVDRYPEDELVVDAFPQALNDSRVEDPSLLRPVPQEDTAPLQGSLF